MKIAQLQSLLKIVVKEFTILLMQQMISKALTKANEKGVQLIDKEPRKGAEGLNIAFLHPKSTGRVLTELCEHPE